MIPVDTVNLNDKNRPLLHSLVTNMDSIKTYVRFFHESERPNYHAYTNVSGFLTFNSQEKKYEVGSYEKITNRSTRDDFVSLNSTNGNFYAEGKIKIVRSLDLVDLMSYGNINFDKQKNEILFSTFMVFDFFFNDRNLVRMADTINTIQELLPIQFNNNIYTLGMSKTIGDTAFNRIMEQMQLFAKPKELPEGYKHSIVLSNVNMKWDAEDNAFKSFGPIGVSNFLDRPVNKTMKGAVEIRYIKQKPEVMIYLEPTPNLWYFFVYKQNSMLSVSSDELYNSMIEKIKFKHRTISRGKQTYTYYLTYPRIKDETLFYYGGGKREGDDKKSKQKKR
ncbi:MAG TPA: hypothetical protein PK990_07445 [Salinivirgaceae bacterium]|nr:hypothetical protein [Salinivirgaceae bacterium]